MSYQERDYEVIDYQLYELPGPRHKLRGPEPSSLAPGKYFSCVGAAQTFGCFCEKPYPALLSDRLGLSPLNLGFAGAGPRFFIGRDPLLRYVNNGKFAVIQVMSGRSENNSFFDSGGVELLTRRSDGTKIGAAPAYAELLENESLGTVRAVVEETRRNWIQNYSLLLERIEVPTILFWFSKRAPEYEDTYDDVWKLFGEFPQLVNRAMVEQIRTLSDEFVECISERGTPQPLFSRFTGEPTEVEDRADLAALTEPYNTYYPSPEMHEDAADALFEVCRKHASEEQTSSQV